MIRRFAIAACVAFAITVPARAADTVEIEHDGLTLLGDIEGGLNADRFAVLVHGTLAHKDMELVQAMQTALADRGIGSLAISLSYGIDRRDGMFDCAVPHKHTMQDGTGEIAAWLNWLSAQRDGAVALIGHSRGGALAAWAMADQPHAAVNALVLIAPGYEDTTAQRTKNYAGRFGGDLEQLLVDARSKMAGGAGDSMIDVPGFLYCQETQASAAAIVSYYDDEPKRDSPTMAAQVSVPVLVIAAERDQVVPAVPEKFATLAEAQKVQLEIVAEADHLFLDFYAEDAADLIDGFLSGR